VAVSIDDVRHIAALARLGLTEERAQALTAELNTILGHMEVLSRVDTAAVAADDEPGEGMPLRTDAGPPDVLVRHPGAFAPSVRDGLLLVPRLATHETAEES
jgi:aspartyl-tRNA(Asn)/glutamyl-tRNA(Gln) amidotransferase subunit C